MYRYAPILLIPFAAACTTAQPRETSSPFAVIAAEYTVPIGFGTALPGVIGGWNDGVSIHRYLQGFTHVPTADDKDKVFVNFGLHPLSGSETHLMGRERGWSYTEAFLFDAWASVSWEFVFENVYERPSRIDLMVTAPLGSLLGELRYQMKSAGVLPWLVDPLGEHGRPFMEINREGFLVGLEKRF